MPLIPEQIPNTDTFTEILTTSTFLHQCLLTNYT